MNISHLSKAKVLAALYNGARAPIMGFMRFDPRPMLIEEAQDLFNKGQTKFDYINGRSMKVDFIEDELNTGLYNRDNGEGAAEAIIEVLNS